MAGLWECTLGTQHCDGSAVNIAANNRLFSDLEHDAVCLCLQLGVSLMPKVLTAIGCGPMISVGTSAMQAANSHSLSPNCVQPTEDAQPALGSQFLPAGCRRKVARLNMDGSSSFGKESRNRAITLCALSSPSFVLSPSRRPTCPSISPAALTDSRSLQPGSRRLRR